MEIVACNYPFLSIQKTQIKTQGFLDVQEIARVKVNYAFNQLKKPVVALDAGFYIDSLNGFPRAFVNFALEKIGLEGFIKLVEGKNKECEFRECLAYKDENLSEPKFFISYVRGSLAYEKKGTMKDYLWSKLGLVFTPQGSKKTLAEMEKDEYLAWRSISRERNSSARLFASWLKLQNIF